MVPGAQSRYRGVPQKNSRETIGRKQMRLMTGVIVGSVLAATPTLAQDIVHDAEYYVLEAQHGDAWAAEDKALQAKLDELREARPAAEHHSHHVG